ncbi:MAG: hypothetical protein V3574_00410, partial [Candidatus Moraniibacteriota bacterium]
FVSTEAGSEDFHLHPDDRFAIDAGTDLSTYFTTDIDSMPRSGSWDIGADETATQIFRSVGPSKTDTLDNDSGHTRSLTELKNGTANFSAALPDNIGVGDAVIIDTNNDEAITSADTLLFISKRNSPTSYQLQTNDGSVPGDIPSNDTYQIYRAYTSLFNAEAGTINSTLSTMGFAFNGGDRDLVANNEQWNIACYANGTTADTTGVTVADWTTGPYNFFKIYTPVSVTEVGVSQMHGGKWDNGKYILEDDGTMGQIVTIAISNVKIEGLQISNQWIGGFDVYTVLANSLLSEVYINNNILKFSGSSSYGSGIVATNTNAGGGNLNVYNNIVYDFPSVGISALSVTTGSANVFNNTVYNSGIGIYANWSNVVKNNIVQNCTNGFDGTFGASSDYNISDISGDAPNASFTGGTADVLFIDEANDDFRLSSDDTAAKGAGLNLSADADLSFFDDIRGQARPASPAAWSIGASESQGAGKIKLEGTQIKLEGDAKFE